MHLRLIWACAKVLLIKGIPYILWHVCYVLICVLKICFPICPNVTTIIASHVRDKPSIKQDLTSW
jgi:hypothetical protein